MPTSPPASLVTLAGLETDPHPVLARLRSGAPVSWVPALGAWLVTGYDPGRGGPPRRADVHRR